MKRIASIAGLAALLVLAWLASCGGSSISNSSSSAIGTRLGSTVSMKPGPPSYLSASWSGSGPNIRIDRVISFSSTVHADGTNIYEPTTQVAYGQITGSASGVTIIVYSFTNLYYIQPLTSTTIDLNNSTWIAPAHDGVISALLVRQGYSAPDTTSTLPAVDGTNVLTAATQP